MRPLQLSYAVCYKIVQLLTYTGDIDIIERIMPDVIDALLTIERESAKMGHTVNEGMSKYIHALYGFSDHG